MGGRDECTVFPSESQEGRIPPGSIQSIFLTGLWAAKVLSPFTQERAWVCKQPAAAGHQAEAPSPSTRTGRASHCWMTDCLFKSLAEVTESKPSEIQHTFEKPLISGRKSRQARTSPPPPRPGKQEWECGVGGVGQGVVWKQRWTRLNREGPFNPPALKFGTHEHLALFRAA